MVALRQCMVKCCYPCRAFTSIHMGLDGLVAYSCNNFRYTDRSSTHKCDNESTSILLQPLRYFAKSLLCMSISTWKNKW